MGAEDKAMVIDRKLLFSKGKQFQGFMDAKEFNFMPYISTHSYFARRGDPANPQGGGVENDSSVKQIIPYCAIANISDPNNIRVYAFERSANKAHAHESRLHGKVSIGVGGHVNDDDGNGVLTPLEVLRLGRDRELGEEVFIEDGIKQRILLGFINDELDEVGRVHFGLGYLVLTNSDDVHPASEETKKGRLHSLDELDQLVKLSDDPSSRVVIEGWSKIYYSSLRKILVALAAEKAS